MASVVAMLKIEGRDGRVQTRPLKDGESIRIGRIDTADLQLDDASVSRTHAMISASASGVVVSDLNSTNGTYVNGAEISIPVDLQPRDVVDIGPFKLSVTLHSAENAEATTVKGRTMTAQLKTSNTVVLVARIRGFKDLQGSLAAGPVDKLWTAWQGLVAHAVTANGGKIDKVLNECVLAVWYGADLALVSASAVKAAQQIDLHTRQYSVCGEWPYHEHYPLTCSLAMSSGLALIGSVGGRTGARDFAVLGDTINLAFKVAEVTEALSQSVFISQEIALQLEAAMRMQRVGAVEDQKSGERTNVFAVQL